MADMNVLQNLDHELALPVDFDIKEEEIDLGEDVIIMSDEDDTECFLCERCGFTSSSQSVLLRHATHHNTSDLKMFTCGECLFKTGYKGDLNLHISVSHSPELKPIPISNSTIEEGGREKAVVRLKCDQCMYQTFSRASFTQHHLDHQSKRKLFYCGGSCPFNTDHKEELIKHISNEHTLKWCKHCKMATCKCSKEQPKKQHAIGEECNCQVGKIFKCSQCNSFKETCKQKVLEHMRWYHQSEIKRFLRTGVKRLHAELLEFSYQNVWYKCGKCCYKTNCRKRVFLHFKNFHKK